MRFSSRRLNGVSAGALGVGRLACAMTMDFLETAGRAAYSDLACTAEAELESGAKVGTKAGIV